LAVIFLVWAFSTTITALSFRLVFLSRLVREEEPVAVPDLLSSGSAAVAALVFRVSRAASAKEMRSLLLLLLTLPASTTLAAAQLLLFVLPWPLLVVSRSTMRVKLKKKKKNALISQEDVVKHAVSPWCSNRLHAGMIKELLS
jgi:hypothetical protein